jgi:hypothetical protein
MLLRFGGKHLNSAAIRKIRRVADAGAAGARYDVEYHNGDCESVITPVDLDESMVLVAAPEDHVVLIVSEGLQVIEEPLMAFQADPDSPKLPHLITPRARYQLSKTVGLLGPSGRVSTDKRVFETQAEFLAAARVPS